MRHSILFCLGFALLSWHYDPVGEAGELSVDLPSNLQVVLENTHSLQYPRQGRLPLYVLPISNTLVGIEDTMALKTLGELDRRGIGYTVDWSSGNFEASLAEGLRIGKMQQSRGLEVAVNATACLYSFFDGSEQTLHVDNSGNRFSETSFGGKLGCPFALEHRYPMIKERIESFLRAYKKSGIEIDFVFADWEIDGPIEWNDAWASSKRCSRCRESISKIEDFRQFQQSLRQIRSELQRVTFGDNVTSYFPQALVGNYGVYPHDGYRYWYDYFEHEAEGVPYRLDQKARYREWYHEFEGAGYTFAMPVVYTWYPTFNWYDFKESDYRWFYNMLLVGSNAGRHTPQTVPIIPFVHWTTTAPPEDPDPNVKQFSSQKYQDLLWHLLLRGHDTFFLWCTPKELAQEIRLVQQVYSASLAHAGFLERGTPIRFEVPQHPSPVISGLRLGNRVLVKRTEFGNHDTQITLRLSEGEELVVPRNEGVQVLRVRPYVVRSGFLKNGEKLRFPIGFYELPKNDEDLQEMADAGVNIVRCGDTKDLDRAYEAGLMGWASLSVQQGATESLKKRVISLAHHPALAVWEGPDEIVWTFTAYSYLERVAGFTREDWNNQTKKAVSYAEEQGRKIIPKMREGIQLVRDLDQRNLPFWINEAADSDVKYVRDYVDAIDITGCDYYAVREAGTDLQSIGRLIDRWDAIGGGKPVWMVLQAFSWHSSRPDRKRLYPSFADSRFMAYDAIVHGARGLFYWGSEQIDDPSFRRSLYALTAEIAALEPFLVGTEHHQVGVQVIDNLFDSSGIGVRATLKQNRSDFLLILVNEDSQRHLGVDLTGLEPLEGRRLHLLYGSEQVRVQRGGFVTRLQGFEVKVFSTNPGFVTQNLAGRDYDDSASR